MIAEVIVDISNSAVDKVFEYSYDPKTMPEIEAGMRVKVPFGTKVIEGYVISTKSVADISADKLKSIISSMDDFKVITDEMLELMRFLVKKYHLRVVDILRLFIPAQMRQSRVKPLEINYASLNPELPFDEIINAIGKTARAQISLAEILEAEGSLKTAEINKTFSPAVLKSLVSKNLAIITKERQNRKPYKSVLPENMGAFELKPAQINAKNRILSAENKTILLHGITGSGKTEVYINCILDTISKGKTAIMLVPEISLTPQVLRVFRERFGDKVALLHSGLSYGERFDEWCRLRSGDATIAIGARSAVFAPLNNLGIIIIDEEHDSSYISENNPRYLTHEIAGFRKDYNNCNLVLGSATPSIETFHNAKIGNYELVELPERINERKLPEIQIVDMARELRAGNRSALSRDLIAGIENVLNSDSQAIIFLNRRGFASFQMCKSCGHIVMCSECDVSMVYHRQENLLKCHYCNNRHIALTKCPECGSDSIKQGNVGTERIVHEISEIFPHARILRMDNDTTKTKDAHNNILSDFRAHRADILVGTQMVAKGHDFPFVTLVGIIDADQSLYISDYRSSERTFQLITQVSGRAGRADLEGKVILQTFNPRHYVYRLAVAGDYKGFFEKECNTREVTKYPPFCKILRIIVSGVSEEAAVETLRKMNSDIQAVAAVHKDKFIYLRAMKSPIKKLQGRHRVQILMRIKDDTDDNILSQVFEISQRYPHKDIISFAELNPQNLS